MSRWLGMATGALLFFAPWAWAAADCPGAVAWQVLGSGGPELNARAQSGHVLWLDGKARALFDTGAGTAVAFGKSGGRIEDLRFIALSHLHSDHSADLPVYLKAGIFGERETALPVFGPPAGGGFPSLNDWLASLIGDERSAYPYLSGFLHPQGEPFRVEPHTLSLPRGQVSVVFDDGTVRLLATPVRHGPVPALAWRVETGGRSVVYLGDTDAREPALAALAKDADLLVANLAIAEGSDDAVANALHAPPSRIAILAAHAGARRLLLSHLMKRSEQDLPHALSVIAGLYTGTVEVAWDGQCLPLEAHAIPADVGHTP